MIAFRRTRWNHSLQRATMWAAELGKPLIVFEALRIRYRWASDRLHRFVIEGMRDNQAALRDKPVTYYPYVEPQAGAGTPLLHELASRSCVVVTDEYPCFFLPRMIRAVQDRLPARLECVDSNGVLPLRLGDRTFTVAHSYRRFMQKQVLDQLAQPPMADPIPDDLPRGDGVPKEILKRWPAADLPKLLGGGISDLPIDHSVPPSPVVPGGPAEAENRLREFVQGPLLRYDEDRNHPDEVATTQLSPHLHFGHLSAFAMVDRLLDLEHWTPDQASPANGKNHGFWNVSESTEALLDQVLTWRELGFNQTFRNPDGYDRYDNLPEWSQKTLEEHAADPRPEIYDLEAFENSRTHDELWNAAQRQLVQQGIMHNYMRMLWGKKILHWTPHPREALRIMEHLNNKYGLDGRDPNSYSGIFWVLGRFDRAWGPKRPIFGSVRYMTSDSTRKKLRLKAYLRKFSGK
ncbi:MAG: deoxyribodipyrimidine photolyase [Planctomycetota bacterium]